MFAHSSIAANHDVALARESGRIGVENLRSVGLV